MVVYVAVAVSYWYTLVFVHANSWKAAVPRLGDVPCAPVME